MRQQQRRCGWLGLVACALPVAGWAASEPPAPRTLAPGIWMIPETMHDGYEPDGNSVVFEAPHGLVVVDTGRHAWHREALLRKIADDTKLLQSIFTSGGQSPAISMAGLEGRVLYRPSGPLELEMYIPYSIVLGSPQPQR